MKRLRATESGSSAGPQPDSSASGGMRGGWAFGRPCARFQAIGGSLRLREVASGKLLAMSELGWHEVRAIARFPAANLSAKGIPSVPGVYVWFREGEPIYVGEACGSEGLKGRLRAHLASGVDLSRSSLRASVASQELGTSGSSYLSVG